MRKVVGRIRFLKSAKIGLWAPLPLIGRKLSTQPALPVIELSRSRLSGFRCAAIIRDG